jgi:hypothetical protein
MNATADHYSHYALLRDLGLNICSQVVREAVGLFVCQAGVFIYNCYVFRGALDVLLEVLKDGVSGGRFHR